MAGTRTRKGTQPLKTSKLPEADLPEATRTVLPARTSTRAASKTATRSDKRAAPKARGLALERLGASLRPILLLGGSLSCVYATVALASYNPMDPSFSRASGSTVTNAAGPVGAWVGDLLFQLLGHGAWSVVPVAVALALLLARRPVGGLLRVTGAGALLWAVLGMVATAWPARPGVDFPPGGLLGEVTSQNLLGLVGPAGTWIVLVGAALAALPFVAPLRLEDLAARLVGGVEGAAPQVGRAGLSLGRRAVGGVAAAGAAVVERVREARAEEAQGWPDMDPEDDGEDEDEDLAPDDASVAAAPPAATRPALPQAPARPTATAALPASPRPPSGVRPVERPHSGVRPVERPTAWSESVAPRLAAGLAAGDAAAADAAAMTPPASPTFASGRALVEVEWEPTVAPDLRAAGLGHAADVRDTVPAAQLYASADEVPDWPPPKPAALSVAEVMPSASASRAARDPQADPLDAPEPASLPALRAAAPASASASASAAAAAAAHLDEDEDEDEDEDLLPVLPRAAAPAAARPGASRGAAGTASSRRVSVTPGQLISGGESAGADLFADGAAQAFELPHLGLLDAHERDIARFDEIELQMLAQTLEAKLADFGVKGEVVAIRPGPVVTTFEYVPAPGIKLSKISGLSDDVAMALKALRVRIVAPIPGKGVVGIEIPNKDRQTVWLRDMLASESFRKHPGPLPMVLGKTVEGKPYVGNLASMPHLLVGGTTGSGKSVGVNAMLLSMLYTRTPEELRLILIDPKMLEFELYKDIPHLLHPVVTEPKLASAALKWACIEMDERYRILSRWGVRNIASFNKKIEHELEDWSVEKAWRYAPADWPGNEAPPVPKRMPYIVIVIDELADLMMVAAKDVEESIIRLAQKARAAGIHLIVATQRPSVNVITGLIKANMPSRIAFQVRTKVDGRTILDQNGAENLLGKGDLLFLPPGVSDLERVHGPFVSDEEVRRVTDFLRDQGSPHYEAQITADDEDDQPLSEDDFDDLYDVAVAYVCRQGKASASMIQREFKIGYNRAARILEFMEREGVVGPADGARPREVLVGSHAS